ncbi:MAG TPA: S-adenosylmethionine:tRNA ribosyltransferase-isomerase [Anaerolineales bacterium]|nr:S-adenosylmethionine:tRNA ribosyltransferase-isomerase [Anaerolineales bacterium]
MNRTDLLFHRPETLAATAPPETRGLARDEIRLMISTPVNGTFGHQHGQFLDLPEYLHPGDLLVVNESATLPASLPAHGPQGAFLLNLSTHYGNHLWLTEPRWNSATPGNACPDVFPVRTGDMIEVGNLAAGGLTARVIMPYPGLPRLWFVQFEGDVHAAMKQFGHPIVYGYIENPPGLDSYQTIFATTPGSAEMPSAARPFTRRVLDSLTARGVQIAPILLHTGVSSLEVETDIVEEHPLYPEPFWVPGDTARAVNAARAEGRRVIAIGTTVVRALESAWDAYSQKVRSVSGFTRLYIHPQRGVHVVDGLLTGMHDPVTSHLAMLYAIAGKELIQDAYREALAQGYLWHEFGDSHLIVKREK